MSGHSTIAYASLLSREGFKVQPYDKGASSGSNSPTNSKRPLRTDAVARRLIAGALGINLGKKSAEALARDEEKKRQIIDERREQARAVAKREEEVAKAWDD
ncbi:hypothetical protein BC830DRAFT_1104811 [Chytriomyces sp. MP71]|nr:hypothetical protein BC830DRAFT_1104811 [Chytriomyces sp. MP71]